MDEPFYFWRQHVSSATKQQTEQKKMAMIRSYFWVAAQVRKSYDRFPKEDTATRQFIADKALMLELKALEQLAQLKQPAYSQILRELRKQKRYPVRKLPEATYSVWECAREPSGLGTLRNIFQYYSTHSLGLFLSAMPYRLERTKIMLSRKMRKNSILNKMLDLKNAIRR